MRFLKIFKRKNVPGLEEDFIQDPTERLIEEGRAGKTGRLPVDYDPIAAEEFSAKVRKNWRNNISNPTSPRYIPNPFDEK